MATLSLCFTHETPSPSTPPLNFYVDRDFVVAGLVHSPPVGLLFDFALPSGVVTDLDELRRYRSDIFGNHGSVIR